MNKYLIAGLAIVIVAMAIGIEPLTKFKNEITNYGSLTGVETCMSYSSSELLSAEVIKATCVASFQKTLYENDHATGKAGPRAQQQSVYWGGTLANKTADHVTTWVRISVFVYDAEGDEEEHLAETEIWIEPRGEAEFRVELPEIGLEEIDGIVFCEREDIVPVSCMTWGVTDIKGLTI